MRKIFPVARIGSPALRKFSKNCKGHLAAIVWVALATGCRAHAITGLEQQVDLERHTAWLDQTKNGTPGGVPLNVDAAEVLENQVGMAVTVSLITANRPGGN